VRYPQKRDLILVHSRPPHLETPFALFNEGAITPNDAFFVRAGLNEAQAKALAEYVLKQ
jgi:hypothetical protein